MASTVSMLEFTSIVNVRLPCVSYRKPTSGLADTKPVMSDLQVDRLTEPPGVTARRNGLKPAFSDKSKSALCETGGHRAAGAAFASGEGCGGAAVAGG